MIEAIITCDKCGRWMRAEAPRTELLRMARRDGWSTGKEHFCPSCRRQKRKKQIAEVRP